MADRVDVFFTVGKRSRIVRLFENRDSVQLVFRFGV